MSPPVEIPPTPAVSRASAGWKIPLQKAFTLVEMLVVMLVIVLLITATTPLIKGIFTARNVGDGLDAISGYFAYARTQAVTQNTYVLVGFNQAAGSDDLQIGSVVSVNGTFDPNVFTSSQPVYLPNYPALGNIVHVNNVTLVPSNQLGSDLQTKLTTVQVVPDGVTIMQCSDPTVPGKLAFVVGTTTFARSVVAFTPQGEALFFAQAPGTVANFSSLPFYGQLFFGLRATRGGNVVQNDRNSAALTVDGGSGDIKTFRQ